MKKLEIDFTRINNDINGNPRYVCHFLEFKPYQDPEGPYQKFSYEQALNAAKKLGGRKFHNKQYGGGIVFQSYNIQGLTEKIMELTGHALNYHRDPTKYELHRGYGALHHRTFLRSDCLNKKGDFKKWFKANDDKLNYSRS